MRAGSAASLEADGRLLTKLGSLPVLVVWHEGRAYALEDRCPHMGVPLHRGTCEDGLLTCHWHHARFDLASGCTLDRWADDTRAFDVEIVDDDVWVSARVISDGAEHLHQRLREGLEDGTSLVIAKAVLGLVDAGVEPAELVRTGLEFGARNRAGGWGAGLTVLVAQTAVAGRSEEGSEWRYPDNLVALLRSATEALPDALERGATRRGEFRDVAGLGERLLGEDPAAIVDALLDALRAGADEEQVGRAVALAASRRVVRFHTQNDFGDWDTVHHTFTAANALHQALVRAPTVDLLRGAFHGALRVYLDRFLNVPPARLPAAETGSLEALIACFDVQGDVDVAGNEASGYLRGGGSRASLVAALGRRLLDEDVGFHTYQHFEACVRQAWAWPEGSAEAALILTGCARYLAAHAPTRRGLPTVITIASRLRRGEHLFEEAVAS